MTFEEELIEMPWKIIERISFGHNSVIITFRSGNQMEATPPNDKQFNQLKEQARIHLHEHQIFEDK